MPEYSNFLSADLDQIKDRALRATYGAAVDELDELVRGIEIADRAV